MWSFNFNSYWSWSGPDLVRRKPKHFKTFKSWCGLESGPLTLRTYRLSTVYPWPIRIFSCLKITHFESLHKLRNFYSKSSYAWGLPILASKSVKDAALKEACENVYIMLADRADVRKQISKNSGKFGVLGEFERIRQIPEYSYLPSHYDRRARGIGPAYK